MGATESRSRGDAGEIVTVDPGRHGEEEAAEDPVLQQLALLTSVEPILPSGDVSFGEQLAEEFEAEDGPPGATAAANAIKALRSWNRERADGVAATQELLMTRVDRAELLSADVMRRATRAGAVGRMLAADLKHARPLQQELATLGAQLCAVLESYAQLLKTFEAAAARRPAGASPLRPATQPALPLSPLRLAASPAVAPVPGGFALEPPAPSSARAGPSWSYVGRGDGHNSPQLLRREAHLAGVSGTHSAASSPRGSPRVGRPDMPDSPESLGRAPRGSPPRFSLDGSRGSGSSRGSSRGAALGQPQPQQPPSQHAQQVMLPPVRVPLPPVRTALQEAKPLSPATMLRAGGGGSATAAGAGGGPMPPTPQSKRALFGAVAEAAAAAAAAGGAPISASIAVTSSSAAAASGSPRAAMRPEAPGARPFALEAVGSPRHVRLGPVAASSPGGGGGADRPGSPSMLRLDPWRSSGADAFSLGPPALGSAEPSSPRASAALQPLQPPRSPLRGMGRRGEGATPRAMSGLGPTPRAGGSLFSDAQPAVDVDADPQDYRMAATLPPGPGAPPTRRLS